MVEGQAALYDVILSDKNDIRLRESVRMLTSFNGVGIHETAEITCPLTSGTGITSLNFNVELLSCGVVGVDIELRRAALEIILIFIIVG